MGNGKQVTEDGRQEQVTGQTNARWRGQQKGRPVGRPASQSRIDARVSSARRGQPAGASDRNGQSRSSCGEVGGCGEPLARRTEKVKRRCARSQLRRSDALGGPQEAL